MKRLYLLFSLSLLSCADKNEILEILLSKKLVEPQEKNLNVVLLSESDCVSCTALLVRDLTKLFSQSNTLKTKGIFFYYTQNNTKNAEGIEKLNTLRGEIPHLEWKVTTDNTLFILASQQANSFKGPYEILIRDGKVQKVSVLK